MARPPPCPRGAGSWALAGGDATGRAGAEEILHPIPEHIKEQGVLLTPYTHTSGSSVRFGIGGSGKMPQFGPRLFFCLSLTSGTLLRVPRKRP